MNKYTDNEFVRKTDNFIYFKNFSTKDGLSSGLVLDILQDKYGMMWFATINGLTRYDGNSFTIYRNQKESESSLSDNAVMALAEDVDGNLWVGTKNGLNRYDRNTNTFVRYFVEKNTQNSIRNNQMMALYSDKDSCLWILTKGGYLSRLNIRTNEWKHINLDFSDYEGEYYYNHILEDFRGYLWVGGRNIGPYKVVKDSMTFEKTERESVVGREATFFTETSKKQLLSGNVKGYMQYYDTFSNKYKDITSLQISATSAVCDKNGKIWIGGSPGIEQFDLERKEITVIKNNPFNSESLIANRVYCIYKDKYNCIWIGTEKGVSLYSEGLNIFRRYKLIYGLDNSPTSNAITALMQDREGLMWVGTFENGVDTFSLERENFGNLTYNLLRHDLDEKTFNRERNVLKQYFRHQFIMAQNVNLKEEHIFDSYQHYQQTPLAFRQNNENRVSAFYQDKAGRIYVGLWSFVGFNIYDKNQSIFKRHALWGGCVDNYPNILEGNPFGANWYAGFLEDNQSNLWVITWEALGLNLFDRQKGEFAPKHYIQGNKPRKNIASLAFDSIRQRMYMVGSNYYGYYDFSTRTYVRYGGILPDDFINRDIFERYYQYCNVKKVNLPYALSASYFIYQDSVILISHGDPITGTEYLIKHRLDDDKFETVQQTRSQHSVPDKRYVGKNHEIWDYTTEGLVLTDSNGKVTRFQYDSKDKNGMNGNIINCVCEDGDGNLWISTENGLCLLNRKTMQFTDLSMPDDKTLTSRLMSCIMQDDSGKIWLGTTENGISVLNPETDRLHHYIHHDWDEQGISDNYIYCMYQTKNRNIWIGSKKGLDKYNPEKDNFIHINELSGYRIMNIQEDNSGNLWISTNNGLICLNGHSNEIIRNITDFPGLQGSEFSKAGCKLNNGYLAFGGDFGFNIFNPELLTADFESKPIVFSNFMVGDSLRYFDLNGKTIINLKYSENSFSISFSSTDYEFESLLKYRYKLEGFEEQWTYSEAPGLTAKYTNIPSGKYTFTVEVSNCFGEWKNLKKELIIKIATPWYKQSWFIILLLLLLIAAIYLLIRIREVRLKQDNIRLEHMVEQRTGELKETNRKLTESEEELRAMNDSKNRFFGVISHDLRNPLKSLSLTTQSLYEQYDSLDEKEKHNIIRVIHETTEKTGLLLENLLLWVISQMNMLKPTFKKIHLSSLLDMNIEILQLTAEKKNMGLINRIPQNIYVSADDNLLSTIFRNLISNAIHFSYPDSEIIISAVEKGERIEISVADKGVGISKENQDRLFRLDAKIQTKGTGNEKGSGLGLIITQEFVHLQGGNIGVKSAENEGSVFTFTLNRYKNGEGD